MNEALQFVKPEWREEFRRFATTGKASPEFMEYADTDPDCERAMDLIINIFVEALSCGA